MHVVPSSSQIVAGDEALPAYRSVVHVGAVVVFVGVVSFVIVPFMGVVMIVPFVGIVVFMGIVVFVPFMGAVVLEGSVPLKGGGVKGGPPPGAGGKNGSPLSPPSSPPLFVLGPSKGM